MKKVLYIISIIIVIVVSVLLKNTYLCLASGYITFFILKTILESENIDELEIFKWYILMLTGIVLTSSGIVIMINLIIYCNS